MSTDTRFASLLAFAESRMALASDDCGRDGGRFGDGNTCQAGAGSGKEPSQTALRLRHGIASGVNDMKVTREQLQKDRPFRGADKMESLSVKNPKEVAAVARDRFGINDMETPLRIGAAVQPGSSASVSEAYGSIRVESEQPLDSTRPELGNCRVKVKIDSTGSTKSVHYAYLGVDPTAVKSLDSKKFSERRIASEVMARMLDSMSAADRAGLSYADMIGAGQGTGSGDIDHTTGALRGYKLWPTFGFDGEIMPRLASSIPADALHPEAADSLARTGTLTVQQLWLTRKGEEWWKTNGTGMPMKFDFKAKDSLGHKRYSRLLSMQANKKSRGEKRSIVEWALYHGVEYRDRQLTLGLSGDNCGRDGGQFATGNTCQAGGSSALDPPEKNVSQTANTIAKSMRRNADSVSFTGEQIAKDKPFTTTNDIKALKIDRPKQVSGVGRQMGLKSIESVVRIGAALNEGSDILVQSQSDYSSDVIHVYSTQPIDKTKPELGDCTVHVSLRDKGDKKYVHYDLLQVNSLAASAIARGVITEYAMGAAVMDRMTDSLKQAEKNGFDYADTYGAGRSGYHAGDMRGYKLWPTFGFDTELPGRFSPPKEVLTDEAKSLVDSGQPLTLQHLIASRAGEEWWEKNGSSVDMKLNFKDKESLGYKRYSRLLRLASRRKTRQSRRAFIEWAIYESRGGNYDEYETVERRSSDCNRNEDGEFAAGNQCQDDDGQPAAIPRSLTGKKDFNQGSDKLAESPPFPAAAKLENLIVRNPKDVTKIIKDSGIKSYDRLLQITCGDVDGAEVELEGSSGAVMATVYRKLFPGDDGDLASSHAFSNVSVFHEDGKTVVDYHEFNVTGEAAEFLYEDSEEALAARNRVGSEAIRTMIESMSAAVKAGVDEAQLMAAGRGKGAAGGKRPGFKGYRLWPQVGYDGEVPERFANDIVEEISDSLSEEAKSSYESTGTFTVQQLWQSKAGERWWKEKGGPLDLRFDFKDKSTDGYKRYARFKKFYDRGKKRGEGRSFIEWVVSNSGTEPGEWPGFPPSAVECRIASLTAFIESRDADCGRIAGKFAPGNNCQQDGLSTEQQDVVEGISLAIEGNNYVGLDQPQLGDEKLFKGASKLESLEVENSLTTLKLAESIGVKDHNDLLSIGACDKKGAKVTIWSRPNGVTGGTEYGSVYITSRIPVTPGNSLHGQCSVKVQIERDPKTNESYVHYDYFKPDDISTIAIKDGLVPKSTVSSAVYDLMSSSLEAAEKSGLDYAETYGVNFTSTPGEAPELGELAGYKLWPFFGFDAPLGSDVHQLPSAILTDDQREKKYQATMTVQDLVSTREGANWWRKNGWSIDLKLDFRDKESQGYKRYQEVLATAKRARARKDRRSMEFAAWVTLFGGEPTEFRGYSPDLDGIVERRDDDCGREGGRFAKGNRCQDGADEGQSLPQGLEELSSQEGVKITSRHQSQLLPAIEALGFGEDPKSLMTIAVATKKGSSVSVTPFASEDGQRAGVSVKTDAPLDVYNPQLGKCEMDVEVTTSNGLGSRVVEYNWFGLDDTAAQSVSYGDYPLHRATSQVIDLMTASLEQAEKSGISRAKTFGAREEWSESAVPQPGELVGFRLWPKFGFDAVIPRHLARDIPNDVLSPRAGKKLNTPGQDLTIQDVIESPKGRRWWNENGEADTFELDFNDKSSLGYQRFQKMRSMAERIRREKRSFDVMAWAFLGVFDQDEIERRSSDCGRDAGGRFDGGNKCQDSSELLSGLEELLGDHEGQTGKDFPDLRYEDGTQTEVARKLHQMKVKETDLAELVKQMGGEPARTRAMIVHPNIQLTVVSSQGKDLYHIDLGYEKADIYPTGAVSHRLEKITEQAAKAFPKSYFRKGTDFHTTTHDSPFEKPSRRALDCRLASLVAFSESRNCGNGPGGFQKGNTCATGAAIDAAKGAAKGALQGALLTTSFSYLPQHLAAGTAIGAGIGAVKGLYDNQMHPTRVMKRISDIGSSEERISEMVKSLGGSPQSSAHLGKRGVSLHIKDKDGNHVFTVDVDKDTAVVYPRRANGELTNSEIDKVKEIAQKGLPSHVDIVVKSKSWHYTAKLARKGFVITAKTAGSFIASYALPTAVDTLVGDAAFALAKRFPKKV